MSWEDRDYGRDDERDAFGGIGGNYRGVGPRFDNPLTWAITLGRFIGITIRVHGIFLAMVIILLLSSAVTAGAGVGLPIMAIDLALLFLIVLLHEFGHCIACRRVGGAADEILMWPLGGLAFCVPPNTWRAHFITVIGGPLVNVVICAVLTVLLGVTTDRWVGLAIPNPFSMAIPTVAAGNWWLITLYSANQISFFLLLFNLIPMFPLDGGRVLQSLLWPRLGYVRSMYAAVRTGFVMAVLCAMLAFIITLASDGGGNSLMLFAIAAFGFFTCWTTLRQLRFTQEMLGFESDEYALRLDTGDDDDDEQEPPRDKRAEREAERERAEANAVDAILEKIASDGMESLSARERRLLRRATDRRRGDPS